MRIKIQSENIIPALAETRVFFLFENQKKIAADSDINLVYRQLKKNKEFKGETAEIKAVDCLNKKLIFAGLGNRTDCDLDTIRKVTGKIIRQAVRLKSRKLLLHSFQIPAKTKVEDVFRVIAESILLAEYKFGKYFSEKDETLLKDAYVHCSPDYLKKARAVAVEGRITAESTLLARDLVNEPANVLSPAELASRAQKAAAEAGFSIEVMDEEKIEELGMSAFLAVARASANRPRLIVMRYLGDPDHPKDITGFAGKGLTFDSGGYSLKTSKGMLMMKGDMGGSAAVIGAISAVARMKLKINLVAVVAACENMLSGRGYRPSDVIRSMAGKTIFIGNTDAEGRLTLIDAVNYLIEKEKVKRIVDIATLTGAAVVCLGHAASAVVSNNDRFFKKLQAASKSSGEKIWRLPAFPEYKELLKTKIADLTNSAGNPGTITAALFIGEFVRNLPWLHLDIAGTFWSDKVKGLHSYGGTGVGVRLLYFLARSLASS